MHHKVRKLVLVGPADGGKTAFSYIIKGLIREKFIARITHESVFALQQIKSGTLLVEMDDWGNTNLPTDVLKSMFQGNNLEFLNIIDKKGTYATP